MRGPATAPMAVKLTLKQFCQRLVESGLMTADEVLAFRNAYSAETRPSTADAMARELILRQKLTPFQAGALVSGRPSQLILGNNVLLEKIGEGGMGEVFKATHRRMRRLVCIKILRSTLINSPYAVRRFQREVQAAAQLSHPNIVTAYDADEEQGVHFLVMEYVEGQDLGTMVARQGTLPVADVVRYIAQAAVALEYAHSKGIVHRDIKPSNLLLDENGMLKVLDMGLARIDDVEGAKDDDSGDSLTRDNQIVGTVEYMSPEQADDTGRVDRRSDIYSLGCTMYRLLVGTPPYQAETPIKVLMAHRLREIPSLRAARPDVPEELEVIYRKMLAKSQADRYQTMSEVLRALMPLVGDGGFLAVNASPPAAASPAATASSADAEDALSPSDSDVDALTPTRTLTWVGGRPDAQAPSVEELAEEVAQLGDDAAGRGQPQRMQRSDVSETRRRNRSGETDVLAVGIDLGTTFSVVAALDDHGRPHAIVNTEGDVITPSFVLFDVDEVVVGKEAVKALSVEAEHVAESVKRELGSRLFHKSLQGLSYPPEVLEAYVLNKLRQDASRLVGDFRKVVITVPAYFDENRRKATQDAGYMAGFEVMDILNEPTAAALAFGFQRGYFRPAQARDELERILVYDLGGGTFDVTVMEIRGTAFNTLATDGDVQLGGRDWDQRLLDYVAEQFVRRYGLDPREDPNVVGRLWRDCEEAKRTLSARQKASVVCDFRAQSLRVEISRALFHELTFDLVERTAFTTRQAIQAAGLEWSEIDRVLLVGGSTRMPAIVEMLRQLSGQDPDNSVAPDEAVAHGAALHAGLVLARRRGEPASFSIRNVNSHSLGIVGTDMKTGRKQNAVIIPRNTPLPVVAKRVFRTHKQGQASLLLQIVEGESTSPDECSAIGRCSVRGLPPNLPAQTPLEVRFHYAENGRITVSVLVPGHDQPLEQEIIRAQGLSREELDQWRLRISGLSAEPESSVLGSVN